MVETKERRQEIKKVLLNNLVLTEDNRLAVGADRRITLWGVGDGAGETFFFGVMKKSFRMKSEYGNNRQAIYQTGEVMKDMGRSLSMACAPEGAAVLVRHVFFRPIVMILEEDETELVLNVYCGRAILSLPSIMHGVSKLEKLSAGKLTRDIVIKEKKERKKEK